MTTKPICSKDITSEETLGDDIMIPHEPIYDY
ncbi:hypothetical protein NMY3_03137 [Candidatus Nitrosocosmicus oleophilus]|uniref:Uncharacterized protein n=1 Tax=Candidatus Nitrosocosmicus oleophilus TaxID=1353260 RepID=A0A654M3Q9_9ARCH|nr:hypothetical protein NMY3_03137 [Candidatus Nitrosocosmicus oleophilus]